MTDPILKFLIADVVALLLAGAFAVAISSFARGFLTTILIGLGMLLCLPPLLLRTHATAFSLPIGPPGLSLHFALDPLSMFFLAVVLLAGTAIAAFQSPAASLSQAESVRVTALCVGGVALSLLAADGVALTLGLAVTCAATGRNAPRMLVPVALLAAICLLTPAGFAPRFDAIRASPIDPDHATAAAALTIAAAGGLICRPVGERCWTQDALTAGVLVPFGSYLLLRVIADLSATAAQGWWGFILLLLGGATALIEGWRAAAHPDVDAATSALIRRQAGLAMTGIGVALIARTADLPGAATFALEATCLSVISACVAGTLMSLAAHVIGASAGTYRLSRLGGLVHTMPGTSAALSVGVLAVCALPPTLGFAASWLLFQSILSAPRTGGLLSQVPLALAAAAMVLSPALATTASIRIVGIAILGRPRTPRGAAAAESHSPNRTILLVLAAVALVAGALPSAMLWLVADPAIHALTGIPPSRGLGLLSGSGTSPGYLPLPVLALLGLAIGAVMLVSRRSHREAKASGPWMEGLQAPVGLPFGDPAAQSAGEGLLPTLFKSPLPRLPRLPAIPNQHLPPDLPPANIGLWLVLAGFGMLLLVLAVIQ